MHQLRQRIPIPNTTKPILQRHDPNNTRNILLRNQTKIHTQKNNPMPQIPEQETNPILKKILAIIFLPLFIFLWTIGWKLDYIGRKKEQKQK